MGYEKRFTKGLLPLRQKKTSEEHAIRRITTVGTLVSNGLTAWRKTMDRITTMQCIYAKSVVGRFPQGVVSDAVSFMRYLQHPRCNDQVR